MNQIANTIYEQIGGNKSMFMVGATNLAYDVKSFMFRFKMCTKFNHCTITLNEKDTYDIRFIKIWGTKLKNETIFNDVFFDQLKPIFENNTGLTLQMPQVVGINC